MSSDLDFIDEAQTTTPPSRRDIRRQTFDSGLKGATRKQAAEATGRKHRTHGTYLQVTFRLPEEAAKRIEAMAAAAGVTKEDMKRWLVLQGMQAWERGERPVLDEEVVRQAVRLEW